MGLSHFDFFAPMQGEMPLICVVPSCKNNSSNPDCFELKWHRLPSKQDPIKRCLISTTLGLPNDITTAKRICSSFMTQVPKGRKPAAARERMTSASGHQRYTILLKLYKVYVLPITDYCSISFNVCSESLLNRLDRMHFKAMRYLTST